jgi:Sap, sulfolipid-1-addressing protein
VSSDVVAVVLLGLACAANPWGIMIAILLLNAKRGRGVVWSYAAAWVGTMSLALAVILAGLGAFLESGSAGASKTAAAIQLALGIVLLGFGLKRVRGDRRAATSEGPPGTPPLPRWLHAIENISCVPAFVLGIYSLTWPMVIAAGGEILAAGVTTTQMVALAVLFVVLGSSTVVGVAAFGTFAPGRSEPLLGRMRGWLTLHNRAVINAILLVFGVALSARGLTGLL